jgi:hypothetical protein
LTQGTPLSVKRVISTSLTSLDLRGALGSAGSHRWARCALSGVSPSPQ